MPDIDGVAVMEGIDPDETVLNFRPVESQTPKTSPVPPRLTVVDHVYYQPGGDGDAQDVSTSFDRVLASGEQIYRREKTVKESEVLDVGWAGALTSPQGSNVALVVIQNLEKKGGAWLRVSFGTGKAPDTVLGILIPPGESARFTPFSSSRVWLAPHCHPVDGSPTVKVSITAVPN